ncbi:hypothetical protein NPIL_25581 [Nephila pilipes]|uniref:Uncharacterized protein n=1 Tax=Nephila pilipes TaxID=299642 RepID=A0A8X6KNZ7_NEPPI|nr:hypothetical protein NPIL_25581 [Nephila pilipes]
MRRNGHWLKVGRAIKPSSLKRQRFRGRRNRQSCSHLTLPAGPKKSFKSTFSSHRLHNDMSFRFDNDCRQPEKHDLKFDYSRNDLAGKKVIETCLR